MRILEINTVNFGSTGHIMLRIADLARSEGHEAVCSFYARRNKPADENTIYIGNKNSHNLHKKFSKYTGYNGRLSIISTWNFLRKVKKFKPDIIHIHNLHDRFINVPMLFKFIKKNNIKVIWTLHDCWSFTGQCVHFTIAGCDKWKTGCHDCPQIHVYPASNVDRTKKMWELKKKWFTGVKDMTIVTPSVWLSNLVKESYLKDYPVKVINNGIDLGVFKPTESDFRVKHDLDGKFIILGAASIWETRKGIDVFIELAKRLDDRFKIVLVGTNDEDDKILPDNIISIHRTSDRKELAEIYSSADLFFNPTREENYPTVNMESIACGTPVMTFKTGGSPEIIDDKTGVVVEDNIDVIEQKIMNIYETRPFKLSDLEERAKNFSADDKFAQYLRLFAANG